MPSLVNGDVPSTSNAHSDTIQVMTGLEPESSLLDQPEILSEAIDPQLSFGDLDFFSGIWMPQAHGDDDITGIEINDLDLRFLDSYNLSVPFELGPASRSRSRDEQTAYDLASGESHGIPSAAFQESPWQFRPNSQDHAGAEEHNLSLPQDLLSHASPESRVPGDAGVTSAPLGVSARDKILAMVTRCCQSDNVSKIFLAFPSVELLNALLQYYFTSHVAWSNSFLHAATFDPNEKKPELVAAMAAAGAMLTSDPALVKLGHAIQEAVRISIPKHWERDNSLTRDLELAQAFLIVLEIGLWSGRRRKTEIAECFLQPLLTMLRRGGWFRRTPYEKPSGLLHSSGKSLDQQWKEWVEREGFKRLCFRILLHDSNCSMSLLVNPLISYAEVLLPLPGPPQTWAVRSAEAWKIAFAAECQQPSFTVADLLNDPELLDTQYNAIDYSVASFAMQSFVWAIIWEYIQLKALQKQAPRLWNNAIMDIRRDELLTMLQTMRISHSVSASHEFMMRLETMALHLFASFEDVQILAGFQGQEQSRKMLPLIKEWINTATARQALYQAGQIFRRAKGIPKGLIRGPIAYMIYYASLMFWVWGSLQGDHDKQPRSPLARRTSVLLPGPSLAATEVLLDGQEELLVHRFVQIGQGFPCIQVPDQDESSQLVTIRLTSTSKVMGLMGRLLEGGFESNAKPYLVWSFSRVIDELGKNYGRACSIREPQDAQEL
ncbi:Transcription factor 1 [Paramyrothecium foliicola]|nr:Transcription factor 1 [Paramyrothecium foliicola]